jgi:hypothetical protein
MKQIFALLFLSGLVSIVFSQYCEYSDPNGEYTCQIFQGVIFEEKVNDPIPGTHFTSRTNDDVRKVTTSGPASEQMLKRVFNFFTHLRTIEFAPGIVQKIDQSIFYNCTELTSLTIGKNDVVTIQENSFGNCFNLKSITLYNNNIAIVDRYAFMGLAELELLDLSENQIRSLSAETFSMLPKLNFLILAKNFITQLPDNIFDSQTKLETLNLEGNRIESLQKSLFEKTTSLRSLDMGGNKINSTERGIFDNLKVLTDANFLRNVCIDKYYPSVIKDTLNSDFEECFKRFDSENPTPIPSNNKTFTLWGDFYAKFKLEIFQPKINNITLD